MTGWAAKRFWKDAAVLEAQDDFIVQLDGKDTGPRESCR